MYRLRRKIAVVLALVVMFTTNIGMQMLPQSMRSTVGEHLIPVADAASSSIKAAVNAGDGHSMAIRSDGTVSCWGDNTYGELGDGTNYLQSTPVNVKGIDNVVAVTSVKDCSYAVKSDGTVWKWGKVESYCPLGTPVKVTGLQDIVDLKAATNFSDSSIFFMALKSDGTVWSWGNNSSGQLGVGDDTVNFTPTQVPDLTNVTAIAAGGLHAVALKSDGTVWCWGGNSYGQLGNGTTKLSSIPVQVPELSGITQIAADGYHTLVLKNDGTVYGWGDKEAFGISSNLLTPTQIEGFFGATKIAAGEKHCVAVKSGGTVWTLGKNDKGQCGISSTTPTVAAIEVKGLEHITDISAINNYNLAIKSDGSVYSWGENYNGALGGGTTSYSSRYTPDLVSGLNLFSSAQGKPEGVLLNKTSITKTVGETERLLATVTPFGITGTGITWSIQSDSGSNTLSLSEDGLITAINPGTCVIRATSDVDIDKYAECTVNIITPEAVTGLTLNKDSITIENGMTEQLTATIQPTNVANRSIQWSVTSGSSVVSVANGRVTALKTGTAVVRATSAENSTIYKECNVTVEAIEDTIQAFTDTVNNIVSIYGKINDKYDSDTCIFTAPKTGAYKISALSENGDPILNSNMDLINSKGTTLKNNQVITFNADLTAGEKYSIDIDMYPRAVCSYKISIEYLKIPVSSVYFSEKVTVLSIGETTQLNPTVSPSNAENKEVTWSIPTDSGIVAVSPSGVVTALKAGTATVRATSVSNSGIYGDCTIVVDDYGNTTTSAFAVDEGTPIYGEINPDRNYVGDSDYFVFTAKDTGWYNIAATTETAITSIKPLVTVYDASGKIIDSNPNYWNQWRLDADKTYYVEVEKSSGTQPGRYTLHIDSLTVHVTGITLPYENDTIQIEPGQILNLKTNILPSDATNKNVTWTLLQEDVKGSITISAIGKVEALKEGKAKVRVTSKEYSNITKDCNIVVKDRASSTNSAFDMQLDNVVDGAIGTSSYDTDMFKFTPSKSDVYKITITNKSDSNFYPYFILKDSNANTIERAYGTGSLSVIRELNAGSTYYIEAQSAGSSGNYSLKIEGLVVPVQSITLNKDKLVLEQGQTTQASITITPDMVSNRNIIWTVPTGSGIVAVSSSGSIEALAPGKAVVRATSEDNSSIYKDCNVTVTTVGDYGEDIDSPYIISDNTTMQGIIDPAGETDCFKFTAPKTCYYRMSAAGDTSGSSLYFKLYDKSGAEIKPTYSDSDYILLKMNSGDICYVKLGMSNSAETGGYTFSVRPKITIEYINVFEMLPGEKRELPYAAILPSNEKVIWSVESGNEFISISGGYITAIKEGVAKLRATSATDPTVYRDCNITVDYGRSISTAYTVEYNKSIRGTFSSTSDQEYFKFTPAVDANYSISAEFEVSGYIDVKIYNSAGSQLTSGRNKISWTLYPGNTYYIMLDPWRADNYVFKIGAPVDSVSISQTTAEMGKGETLKLNATVLPSDAANLFVDWTVQSGSSVKVSSTGEVTALTTGSAVVRATSRGTNINNTQKYAECKITVYDTGFIGVTDLNILQGSSVKLPRKIPIKLSAAVSPADATNNGISWSIVSGSDYIYLTDTGLVTPHYPGKAVVRATSKSNSLVYEDITITVLDDDYGDTRDMAYNFGVGDEISGNIGQSYDNDYFKFIPSRTGGYAISFDKSYSSALTDAVMRLYDSNGTQLAYGENVIKRNLEANQTYFVEVKAKDGSSKTGYYTIEASYITYTQIELSSNYIYMVPDQCKQLDINIYTVDGTDRQVTWTVTEGEDIVSVSSTGLVTSLKPGNATIKASCDGAYTGCVVTVYADDYGNTTTAAVTINENTTVNGKREVYDDYDYFKFIPSKTGTYTIETTGNSTVLQHLNIYDSKGTEIAETYSTISKELKAGHTYFMRMSGGNEGDYTLKITLSKASIPVNGITLSQNSVQLKQGETQQLEATISPSEAANKDVVWTVTSGSGIISVSEKGEVIALQPGMAKIRVASTDDLNIYAECEVTVKPVAVSSINLSPTSIVIELLHEKQLIAEVLPINATNKTVVWSTSDSGIVSVSQTGVIKALKTGTTVVRATCEGQYKDCTVIVINDDYGNTKDLAASVEKNELVSGKLEEVGDTDYFKFTPSEKGIYTISYFTSTIFIGLRIYNSEDEILQYDRIDTTITVALDAHNTYFLEAYDLTTGHTGSYTLKITTTSVTAINLSPASITMTPQEEKQLTVEVLPINATNKAVVWSTSDSGIISVSENGIVTAIKLGTAKVRVASAEDEGKYAECEVTVQEGSSNPGTGTHVTVSGINVLPASITMTPQEEKQLSVEVLPVDATNKAVVWSTSDSEIISVSETGKVTAIKPGTAKIRAASAEDTSKYAECEVTVQEGSSNPGTGNASISMQNADYKNDDISMTVIFNGNTLNGINNGVDKKLVEGQDYVLSDIVYGQDGKTTVSAICTIKNSYLMTLPKEQTTKLIFDFDKGNDSELSVTVPKLDECFIATAAFGSKFQPAVAFLRQFRDQCLLTNWMGTKFVNFYYKNSPPIAQFIAGNDTLRGIVRGLLVPFIAIAYGIMHPVQGCLGLLVIIFAAVLWRKRRRKLINV